MRLAVDGLQYNRFHTTALCSPTRQAMLTGRNHHSAGIGKDSVNLDYLISPEQRLQVAMALQ